MHTLANYSLLTRFPLLQPNFLAVPPVTVYEFWQRIQEESPEHIPLMQAVLLSKEIMYLEQIYAGVLPKVAIMSDIANLVKWPQNIILAEEAWPAVLTRELIPERWSETIWPAYFGYVKDISARYHSRLAEWLIWDWQLKYGFMLRRTKNNKHQPNWLEHVLPLEIDAEQAQIIATYYKHDPWQAELGLDMARWQHIQQIAIPFSFGTDELVAYGLHLLLLERWWLLSQSEEDIFAKVING